MELLIFQQNKYMAPFVQLFTRAAAAWSGFNSDTVLEKRSEPLPTAKYGWNKVKFTGQEVKEPGFFFPTVQARLSSASFRITKLPPTNIMTFNAERNGVGSEIWSDVTDRENKLNFDVKRTKSEALAKWFVNQAFLDNGRSDGTPAKKKCTFGHNPGKLNFVFVGDLNISLMQKDGFYPDDWTHAYKNVIFSGIVFAQGNIGTGHNWWFGGRDCSWRGGKTVICRGQGVDGKHTYDVEFKTGGFRDNNEIEIGEIKQFKKT